MDLLLSYHEGYSRDSALGPPSRSGQNSTSSASEGIVTHSFYIEPILEQIIKPPPPSNLTIRNKRAWYEGPPALFPPRPVMLKHSGISQKTGCGRNPRVTYPGSSIPKSSGVDCPCRRMGNVPHPAELLAQRSSLPFTSAGSTCKFDDFFWRRRGRLSILLPTIKSIHSYCTTNRSRHAPNSNVFLGCQWLLLLEITPTTPFTSVASVVFRAQLSAQHS